MHCAKSLKNKKLIHNTTNQIKAELYKKKKIKKTQLQYSLLTTHVHAQHLSVRITKTLHAIQSAFCMVADFILNIYMAATDATVNRYELLNVHHLLVNETCQGTLPEVELVQWTKMDTSTHRQI